MTIQAGSQQAEDPRGFQAGSVSHAPAQRKAIIAMSGGVDSSVAALLCQRQGFDCMGVTLKLYDNQDAGLGEASFPGEKTCCSVDDVADARSVAFRLGMPFYVFNFKEAFRREVMDRFAAAYQHGETPNPCVDCKILMMRRARERMDRHGARFIASGEVLGQRPMSQRRDTLNVIRRDAGVRDLLLRPLCALRLDPTDAEESGLVDRSRLLGISGRGRKDQLELAARMGITDIPTPAGGCMLTEKENARRYWPLLTRLARPGAADYRLSNVGRQLWHGDWWLSVGRNQADNEAFAGLARPGDRLFKAAGFPGPLALGRSAAPERSPWTEEATLAAAALVASYSPKACRAAEAGDGRTPVRVTPAGNDGEARVVNVVPSRDTVFAEPSWEEARVALQALHKASAGHPGRPMNDEE